MIRPATETTTRFGLRSTVIGCSGPGTLIGLNDAETSCSMASPFAVRLAIIPTIRPDSPYYSGHIGHNGEARFRAVDVVLHRGRPAHPDRSEAYPATRESVGMPA